MKCGVGRECSINPDTNEAECQCIKECGYQADPRRMVKTFQQPIKIRLYSNQLLIDRFAPITTKHFEQIVKFISSIVFAKKGSLDNPVLILRNIKMSTSSITVIISTAFCLASLFSQPFGKLSILNVWILKKQKWRQNGQFMLFSLFPRKKDWKSSVQDREASLW